MNPHHRYEEPSPPPPTGWRCAAVILVFVAVMTAFCLFCASCTCTLDGESVARAIIIYEAGK